MKTKKGLRLIKAVGGEVVVPELLVTETWRDSAVGLLGRAGLEHGAGLLIRGCSSIHMMFMRFAIDAVFLNSDMRIIKIIRELKPWRIAWAWGGDSVLELPVGGAAGMEIGEVVAVINNPKGNE